jgi:hypothetical protein
LIQKIVYSGYQICSMRLLRQKSPYRTAVINGRDTTYARDQLVLGKEEFARSEVLGKKEAERRPETM